MSLSKFQLPDGIVFPEGDPPDVFPFAMENSDEFDGIVFYADYCVRVSRANWVKSKFGDGRVPRCFFKVIVDADVTVSLLDRWFDIGGLQYVYNLCSLNFGGCSDDDDA